MPSTACHCINSAGHPETKGSMESLELRPIEQAKIACAKKLFRGISTNKVVYHEVDSYQNLLAIMKSV